MLATSVYLFALDIPGFGVAHVRVFAAGDPDVTPDATGSRPFLGPRASAPVVVLLNGAGCAPELLQWLGIRLAQAGFAAISFGLLQRIGPSVTWSPGVDIGAAGPTADGHTPPCPVLVPLFAALAADPRCTSFDLTAPIIFGHSAGGSVALLSAGRRHLEAVTSVVTYGAHLVASSTSGRVAGSITPTSAGRVLVIGGGVDGVVGRAITDGRYGEDATRESLLVRTIEEGCPNARWAAAVQLASAGHFACTNGYDGVGSSGHLEPNAIDVDPQDRQAIGDLVVEFCCLSIGRPSEIDNLVADHQVSARINTRMQTLSHRRPQNG